MDRNRPPTLSVDGLCDGMGFFKLCGENGLRQQTVSAAKCAGIAAMAAQGRHSLVRNKVTQNKPGHSTVRAVSSAGRTYSRQESIEVRHYGQASCFGSHTAGFFLCAFHFGVAFLNSLRHFLLCHGCSFLPVGIKKGGYFGFEIVALWV